ncbi:hypothetical protein ZIOFF_065969 [Zingiber officinale]|uniref:FAE domain-containing protein n=1 Tax=Zingiber officinale TaxID=94328 RepID=A0A8J5EXY5_ZINOF|nr:hypothetical protein ZIOFF_065969 [Zingiber officinale]
MVTIPVLLVVFGAEVGSLSREELWRKAVGGNKQRPRHRDRLLRRPHWFTVYFVFKLRPIYLVDFACFRPSDELKEDRKSEKLDEESQAFQSRIPNSSWICNETYFRGRPRRGVCCHVLRAPWTSSSTSAASAPKDVGVNCSLFNPTPSLVAMVVNSYKMRGNILSCNLGGMGCSAGVRHRPRPRPRHAAGQPQQLRRRRQHGGRRRPSPGTLLQPLHAHPQRLFPHGLLGRADL